MDMINDAPQVKFEGRVAPPNLEEFKSFLACPICRGDLNFEQEWIVCEFCKKAFPIVEGIPVMLIDQAADR